MSKEIKFAKTHEWVQFISETEAIIGISDFAQSELGDIVFINLPIPGDEFKVSESFGDVESVKAVSDLHLPVAGVISEINEEILENPAKVNEDPYGAWFVKVQDVTGQDELMNSEEYEKFCKEEA